MIFLSQYLYGFSVFIDTIPNKKQIKLDFISVYYSLFDVREQFRIGLEYEQPLNHKFNVNYHLDLGVFDHYQFNKYYQFFPNNTNAYKELTDVTTFGFHFLYGFKYRLNKPEKKVNLFSGLICDFNFFNKKSIKNNSLDNSKEISRYQQYRLGVGPELGMSFKLYKGFSLEIKSAVLFKLLTIKTKENAPMIKPHKSLWFDLYHNYWIIPRINLCYEI